LKEVGEQKWLTRSSAQIKIQENFHNDWNIKFDKRKN
jgi:hypothetical protein